MSSQSPGKPDHALSLPGAVDQKAEITSHGVGFQQQYGIQVYFANPQGLAMPTASPPMNTNAWPLIRDLRDPIRLGVHPAADRDGDRAPLYVERDIDAELESVSHDRAFILIVGDSTSGKSRTAYELMRRKLGDYKLLDPSDDDELLQMSILVSTAGKCVLWLDDLERFFGAGGLNVGVLDRFLDAGSIVIATMRAEEYSKIGPLQNSRERGRDRIQLRTMVQVLEQATNIHLERRWSHNEISRAAQSSDSRVTEASAHSGLYGVAEYLAAGPQLLAEWQAAWAPGAHPRGAALVAAAVDARRVGLLRPVHIEVLKELHYHYLDQRGGLRLRPEEVADALEWALTPLHATSSLLLPAGNEDYFAFDYLVDVEQRRVNPSPIPDIVWQKALAISSEDGLSQIGFAAELAGRIDIAEKAFGALARVGNQHGMFHLGLIHYNRKEFAEAESSFKQAAEGGDISAAYYIGEFLAKRGEYAEAEVWLRKAADEGIGFTSRRATAELGNIEGLRKRWTAAEKLLQAAVVDGGDGPWIDADTTVPVPVGAKKSIRTFDHRVRGFFTYLYGFTLQMLEKLDEAEKWYVRAAELGQSYAANNLGFLLNERGEKAEAGKWFHRAAVAGDVLGAFNYGRFLHERREYEKAKLWYRKAFESGDSDAAVELGVLYSERKDTKRAKQWLTKAIEAGNPKGIFSLGMLFGAQGQDAKAAELFNEAADAGYEHALVHLGMYMEGLGDAAAAEHLYRQAVAADDVDGVMRLGDLLWRTGSKDQAREMFLLAKEKGHSEADKRLSGVMPDADVPTQVRRAVKPTDRKSNAPRGKSRKRRRRR